MKKITALVSGVLAQQISAKVAKIQKTKFDKSLKEARSSKALAEIKKIQAERDRLSNRITALEEKLLDKYPNTYFSGYGRTRSINARTVSNQDLKDIKNRVIIANHIKGIAPEKLVEYVVKEITGPNQRH